MSYFAQNLKHLRKRSSITQEKLGNEINLGRTTIANYEAGVSSPTDFEVLIRLSNLFQVSIDELLTRDLSVAFSNQASSLEEPPPVKSYNETLDAFAAGSMHLETGFQSKYVMSTPKVIVVDSKGEEKMLFVSNAEAPGYAAKKDDPLYMQSLPCYSLPKHSAAVHRLFEVNGLAMEPRFVHGDKVVCSWVSSLDAIKDGGLYVIVTKQQGILLRRAVNRLHEKNTVQLVADTVKHREAYPMIELTAEQIEEAWLAEYVISTNLAQPLENIYSKIADLEAKVLELSKNLNRENKMHQ